MNHVEIKRISFFLFLPASVCPPLTGNTAPSPPEIHLSFSSRARWICTARRSCSYPGGNKERHMMNVINCNILSSTSLVFKLRWVLSTSSTYRHQIFDDIHVWKRVDFGGFASVGVNLVKARQSVSSIYIHGT